MKHLTTLFLLLLCPAVFVSAQDRPGPLPNGGYLLGNGWTVRPTGDSVSAGSFPMSTALSSDGKYLLVLNAGVTDPGVSVIDINTKKVVGHTTLPDAWLGLTASPSSNLVYVGGGSSGKIYELSLNPAGTLTHSREFLVASSSTAGQPFIGDVALSPDARVLYTADMHGDTIAQINLQSGKTVDHWKTGRRPYRILVSPDGGQLLISSWAEAAVFVHQSSSGILLTKLRVGTHPTDMLWINKRYSPESNGTNYAGRLFVAASNTNSVFSFGVTEDRQFSMLDPVSVAMTAMHPLGMTPSALATDPDATLLFVACSDANAIAIVDLTDPRLPVRGFAPTGWYPTAVRVLPDKQMVALNGMGTPTKDHPAGGSAQFFSLPAGDQLLGLTKTVLANSPFRDEMLRSAITDPAEARFSRTQERPSPIQHVIYVIKGDQSYDGVLGDLATDVGDQSKQRLDAAVTPNQHALARDFVLYDQVYANGTLPADGQNWAVAAIAPDFTVKLSPNVFAGRSRVFSFEGGDLANNPPAGYLWSNALQASLTVRNYGEWVTNAADPQPAGQRQVAKVNDLSLAPITDLNFRGPDPNFRDVDRANEFIREWKNFDSQGQAPQLSLVRLSNDTATASRDLVADNDRALGLLVEGVTHSKLWSSTAIFIVQGSGGTASDSAGTQRIPCWILSPFTHHKAVEHNMFNQSSVLKTIEMILGLRPMTHFDAGAKTMFGSFNEQASASPFTAVTPKS